MNFPQNPAFFHFENFWCIPSVKVLGTPLYVSFFSSGVPGYNLFFLLHAYPQTLPRIFMFLFSCKLSHECILQILRDVDCLRVEAMCWTVCLVYSHNLVLSCMDRDPGKRPTFAKICHILVSGCWIMTDFFNTWVTPFSFNSGFSWLLWSMTVLFFNSAEKEGFRAKTTVCWSPVTCQILLLLTTW